MKRYSYKNQQNSFGYKNIQNFANNLISDDTNPAYLCVNDTLSQKFLNGTNPVITGQTSKQCQMYMSDYCSQNFDSICELASQNTNMTYPNELVFGSINGRPYNLKGLTSGEILIRNTACKKYLVAMGNCKPKLIPFDPTVASSPLVMSWDNSSGENNCNPQFMVKPEDIDNDIVMNKLIQKPTIALDLLINIYNNHKRVGTLNKLDNTNLGKFFNLYPDIFV